MNMTSSLFGVLFPVIALDILLIIGIISFMAYIIHKYFVYKSFLKRFKSSKLKERE